MANENSKAYNEHPLKDVLKQCCISQVHAAKMLEMPLSTLAHYLCGYRKPPPRVQKKLEGLRKNLLTIR